MVALLRNIGVTLEMIKWEHSIFVLPFALCGAMLAAGGWPTAWQLTWIVVAMVAARSSAMAFNRVTDAAIDAENPRTRTRALPTGALSRGFVIGFVIICSAIFIFAASQLNRLALALSPAALAIVMLYSYTKRFTRWSHLVLGLAMGIGPTAAWIAVRGSLDPRILILTGVVLFWGAGFDVLYSCQDHEFDCRQGLYSVPRFFGIAGALAIARVFHVLMIALLASTVLAFGLGGWAIAGVVVVSVLLAYEHSLVAADDLSRINAAFFTTNGFVSVLFFLFLAADVLRRR